jgi:CBS domain-containing protein
MGEVSREEKRSGKRGQGMNRARDIMHFGAECIGADETLETAARKMRDLHIGALPICGADQRLQGIITDRDTAVWCVAEGRDPRATTALDLAQGTPIWVEASAEIDEVLRLMEQHKIRRLPVIDDQRLVGMISEADLATHLSEHEVAQFAEAVYSAPPNL